jgi:hypothetical protein
MATRTTGALALRPTGNKQGGYFFLGLTSGRRINRSNWIVLHIPEEVINQIHALARRSAMPNGLAFADRDSIPLIDPDNDDNDDEFWYQGTLAVPKILKIPRTNILTTKLMQVPTPMKMQSQTRTQSSSQE